MPICVYLPEREKYNWFDTQKLRKSIEIPQKFFCSEEEEDLT